MTQRIATLVVLAVVVIAGCTGGSTPTPTSFRSFEQHNTIYFSGTTTISNGSFVMRGELVGCYGTIGPKKCQDARILLYTENGSLFASEYVGTLHGRRNVSLVTDRIPHYVILTSPDFWDANHTTVRYIFYDEGLYLAGAVVERGELPVSIEPPTATANTTARPRVPVGTATASGTAGWVSTASTTPRTWCCTWSI